MLVALLSLPVLAQHPDKKPTAQISSPRSLSDLGFQRATGQDATLKGGSAYDGGDARVPFDSVALPPCASSGLIASIAVAQPIAHLVNGGFMLAVKGSMHDGANGIGAFIAYCVIYVIIMTTVLHSVFALINFIPDSALHFMGSAVGMHGIADSEGHESQRVFMAAATHGNRVVAGGGGEPHGDRPSTRRPTGTTSQDDHAQNAPT